MRDIMLDIETLSTERNAVVLSISAVRFDLVTGKTYDEIDLVIDWQEQMEAGRHVSPNTLKWWLQQSDEARAVLLTEPTNNLFVEDSLVEFADWLRLMQKKANTKKLKLWGNGSSFDNTIVRDLFKEYNIIFPLAYYCDTDVRTLVAIANIDTRDYQFLGVKHNAIDDCKHQIKYCQDAYKILKGR